MARAGRTYHALTDGQIAGLAEAGASGTEVLVYSMLTRHHDDPEHPSHAWLSAASVAAVMGKGNDIIVRALHKLASRVFYVGDSAIPVLTQVERGRYRHAAIYADNLYGVTVLGDLSWLANTTTNSNAELVGKSDIQRSELVGKSDIQVDSWLADMPSHIRSKVDSHNQ